MLVVVNRSGSFELMLLEIESGQNVLPSASKGEQNEARAGQAFIQIQIGQRMNHYHV